MLFKLKQVGIDGKLLIWIENWISDRIHSVKYRGRISDKVKVKSGVPQGSVLGPILFLIYINDIEDKIKCDTFKFADDTKLVGCVDDRNNLQNDINALSDWCKTWQMPINIEKCKVMHIGLSNPKHSYSLSGEKLKVCKEEKDLGVIFTNDLKFNTQCLTAAKKGNKILGMIYRTIKNRTKKIMLNLYKSLVRPQLDYCINVWRPHLKSDIKILENVQKRFTKSIQGFKKIKYKERLNILKLTSFETRCLRSDLLTCFKVFNNCESLDTKKLFVFNERKSRGNSFKLSKVYCRLDSSKFSFPHRVVDEWNKLKDDVVCSESINAFKGGLDRHLRAMGGLI